MRKQQKISENEKRETCLKIVNKKLKHEKREQAGLGLWIFVFDWRNVFSHGSSGCCFTALAADGATGIYLNMTEWSELTVFRCIYIVRKIRCLIAPFNTGVESHICGLRNQPIQKLARATFDGIMGSRSAGVVFPARGSVNSPPFQPRTVVRTHRRENITRITLFKYALTVDLHLGQLEVSKH